MFYRMRNARTMIQPNSLAISRGIPLEEADNVVFRKSRVLIDIAFQMHNQNVVLKTLVSTIHRTIPVTVVRNRDDMLVS